MTVHGAVMLIAGVWFGRAVVRADVLPRWSGVALALGVVAVAGSQGAPEGLQLVAAGLRDLGVAGMGAGLLVGVRGLGYVPGSRERAAQVWRGGTTAILGRRDGAPARPGARPGGASAHVR
jgi:hypothetical protein